MPHLGILLYLLNQYNVIDRKKCSKFKCSLRQNLEVKNYFNSSLIITRLTRLIIIEKHKYIIELNKATHIGASILKLRKVFLCDFNLKRYDNKSKLLLQIETENVCEDF